MFLAAKVQLIRLLDILQHPLRFKYSGFNIFIGRNAAFYPCPKSYDYKNAHYEQIYFPVFSFIIILFLLSG